MKSEKEIIKIRNEIDVQWLVDKIRKKDEFAFAFKFKKQALFNNFLLEMNVDLKCFKTKYYYFDAENKIHISESENGYVWISNMGLVSVGKETTDKFVNSFINQDYVLRLTLNESIRICECDDVYDIDSYNYSLINRMNSILFHNIVFYFELIAKAYLSLCNVKVSRTHKLNELFDAVEKTIFEKKHNNSFFHIYIIPSYKHLLNHISNISSDFNEAFIKYDDNKNDNTMFTFDSKVFKEIISLLDISQEIIYNLYYSHGDSIYLEQGLFERLIDKCTSDKEKNAVANVYSFLKARN